MNCNKCGKKCECRGLNGCNICDIENKKIESQDCEELNKDFGVTE